MAISATKQYNNLMYDLARDHLVIKAGSVTEKWQQSENGEMRRC